MIHKFITILSFVFITPLFGLVDYSDQQPSKSIATQTGGTEVSTQNSSFSVGLGLDSRDLQLGKSLNQVNFYNLAFHYQTPYQIYFDMNYKMVASSQGNILENFEPLMSGNFEPQIGVTWMNFGSGVLAGTADIYFGVRIPNKNSDFATSRFDKYFGLETSKRFYQVAFAINYEYQLSGDPALEQELASGPMHTMGVGLGWVVSNDISLQLEGKRVLFYGEKNIKDSVNYVVPQITLGMSKSVEWILGARFRTKREENSGEWLKYRLWHIDGIYGNSLFTNLKIAF